MTATILHIDVRTPGARAHAERVFDALASRDVHSTTPLHWLMGSPLDAHSPRRVGLVLDAASAPMTYDALAAWAELIGWYGHRAALSVAAEPLGGEA